GEFVFLIFVAIMIACLIFIFFRLPETKNKSFDEIANQFRKLTGNDCIETTIKVDC
ncbi:hypothetical protein HELRODRAFT_86697, partial [Helobdella robusta]|uniref:Major facilitator superfamily (MFS) profile domain-containing protein n=1 Tax=Helobdella robusta TaxID=6412 RepID=T1G6F4_HELRO